MFNLVSLQLQLKTDIKADDERFYGYIGSKRSSQGNIDPMENENGELMKRIGDRSMI